jgi:hypothetical protein
MSPTDFRLFRVAIQVLEERLPFRLAASLSPLSFGLRLSALQYFCSKPPPPLLLLPLLLGLRLPSRSVAPCAGIRPSNWRCRENAILSGSGPQSAEPSRFKETKKLKQGGL